jgi:tRNA-dihydrouridine synthase A
MSLTSDLAATSNNKGIAARSVKTLHVAPMIRVSTPEFRAFVRILTKKATLWTEMVVDETLWYHRNDPGALQTYLGSLKRTDSNDHEISAQQRNPIVCQLGGITPKHTAKATQIITAFGYDEINLNMDCPSARVVNDGLGGTSCCQTVTESNTGSNTTNSQSQSPQPRRRRQFGAILMKETDRAVKLVKTIWENTHLPVSVKCRVGVDNEDSWEFLEAIVRSLRPYCQRFYIHARKCLLQGLSPAQNRIVPPLNYPCVYRLCESFPDCEFYLNGGLPGLATARAILYGTSFRPQSFGKEDVHRDSATPTVRGGCYQNAHQTIPCNICQLSNGSCVAPPILAPTNLQGVMLGRAWIDHPAQFWDVDRFIYGCDYNNNSETPCRTRRDVLEQYLAYLERIYPRRCCDNNPTVTTRLPSPKIQHTREHCFVCVQLYQRNQGKAALAQIVPSKWALKAPDQIKISSRVVDRSVQPVLGIFFQQPGAKAFRRACDAWSRDLTWRNCGPATLLRMVLYEQETLIAPALDRPLVRTEELRETDVVAHAAPPTATLCRTG